MFLPRFRYPIGCVFEGHGHCIGPRPEERPEDGVHEALRRPWVQAPGYLLLRCVEFVSAALRKGLS